MFQIKFEDYEELLLRLESFVGKRLMISESISRNRGAGHDRHFAAVTRFEMRLESVGTAISGAQLLLLGVGGLQYGASAESIVSVSLGEEVIEIIEWFELKTERKTTISIQGQAVI